MDEDEDEDGLDASAVEAALLDAAADMEDDEDDAAYIDIVMGGGATSSDAAAAAALAAAVAAMGHGSGSLGHTRSGSFTGAVKAVSET